MIAAGGNCETKRLDLDNRYLISQRFACSRAAEMVDAQNDRTTVVG
jgi:hypothetical protein